MKAPDADGEFAKQVKSLLVRLSPADKERVKKIAADLLAGKVARGEVRGSMGLEAGHCLLDALETMHAVDSFLAG